MDQCRFVLHENSGERPVRLESGRYTLSVVPALTTDAAGGPLGARTQLRFTPEIQTGSTLPRPSTNNSPQSMNRSPLAFAWEGAEPKAIEVYSNLAWDITVAPNDYVLIGTWYERPDTLGWQCFARTKEATPVQRMLVLRTTRSTPAVESEIAGNPSWKPTTFSQSPSLAAQASGTALHGNGQ